MISAADSTAFGHGVGDLVNRTTPTRVADAAPVTRISAGSTHGCLVTSTEMLEC
ncbi:MAG TPA: hypothetical protein PKD84_12940 [Propionicimonas sp.]|nr:hypothetical protein [Propionicimonas sp.]